MACEFEVQWHAADGGRATDAVLAAMERIDRLEAQMTVFRPDSELARINRQAARQPVTVEPRLFGLLQLAERLYHETHGAMDITSGPLSRVWGFLERDGRLPSEAKIAGRPPVGRIRSGSTR